MNNIYLKILISASALVISTPTIASTQTDSTNQEFKLSTDQYHLSRDTQANSTISTTTSPQYLYYGKVISSTQVTEIMKERELHFVSFNRPANNVYATVWNTYSEAITQGAKPQIPSPRHLTAIKGAVRAICSPAYRTTRLYNVSNCSNPAGMQSFAHSLNGRTENTRIRVKSGSVAVRKPLSDCPAPSFIVWSKTNGKGSSHQFPSGYTGNFEHVIFWIKSATGRC